MQSTDITEKLLLSKNIHLTKTNKLQCCCKTKPKKRHQSQQMRSLKCVEYSREILSAANKQAFDCEKQSTQHGNNKASQNITRLKPQCVNKTAR